MFNKLLTSIKVAVLFVPFLLCMRVSASALPVATTQTIETTMNAFQMLFDLGFTSGGVYPKDIDLSLADYIQGEDFSLYDAYTVDLDDITISRAPEGWLDTLSSSSVSIYGSSGQITSDSDLYICHIDNGYFHGDCYVDSTGNICGGDGSFANLLLNVGFGGKTFPLTSWHDVFNSYVDTLNDQQLNYDLSGEPITSSLGCYFLIGQYWYEPSGRGDCFRLTSVYVPNCYEKGSSVFNFVLGSSYQLYLNTGSSAVIQDVGWSSSGQSITGYNPYYIYHNWAYDNVTYEDIYSFNIPSVRDMSYDEFISLTNASSTKALINFNGFTFDQSVYTKFANEDIGTFSVVPTFSMDISKDYSLSSVSDTKSTLDDLVLVSNPSFAPADAITVDNPPVVIPDDDVDVFPSTLPFPTGGTGEGEGEGEATGNPALVYDPAIEIPESSIVPAFSNFQIPFITNLHTRYPFSIPWDIASFISSFKAEPTPPAWNFDWTITVLDRQYTHHFEGDLSDFNSLAEIFRNLLLIGFIIALAKFSYDHHF